MKNKLADLNDHLFMQLERLSDERLDADAIDREVKRANAIVDVSDQIVGIADKRLRSAKLVADHGGWIAKHLPDAGVNGIKQIEGDSSTEGDA